MSAASPLLAILASPSADPTGPAPAATDALTGLAGQVSTAGAKLRRAAKAADASGGTSAQAGPTPQTFADIMSRMAHSPTAAPTPAASSASAAAAATAGPSGSPLAIKAAAGAASGRAAAAIANAQAAAAARAQALAATAAGSTTSAPFASTLPTAGANASTAVAGSAAGSSAPSSLSAAGTAAGAAASGDPSAALTGPGSPLNGLASILFAGPLQTPLSTPEADHKAQQIETEVQRLATAASPATLASWSSSLDGFTKTLNAAEKAATGIDPTAPPQGWTEPANFQAARSVLASLKATIAQAQAAQGVVSAPALALAAKPVPAALETFGDLKPKFTAPAPAGQATARLFGADAAATGQGGAAAAAASTVRTAAAQTAQALQHGAAQPAGATAKAEAPKPPSSRDLQLSVKAEAAPATTTPAAKALASPPAANPAASASASPTSTAEKLATAAAQASDQPAANAADQAAQANPGATAAAAAQSAAAPAGGAGVAAQAAAADPTRAAPAAVAYLAAAVVKQANSKSTSFNIELHPADLGRVDVKLQIQADGQLAARMSFDNPAAAASFQAHADELRRSLEQAGFQLSNNSLSFTGRDPQTASGGSGGFAGQGGSGQSGAGARAFAGTQPAASPLETASASQNLQAVGLDMRI